MDQLQDTIVAIATPVGAGGVGIVRLSGPDAIRILAALTRRDEASFESHKLRLLPIYRPNSDEVLDKALAVAFRAPHSYTGQDSAEVQAHGGPLVLQRIVRAAIELGARQAEAGEFTLRAFISGRMDLSQAEAVADLISARTAPAAGLAAEQMTGRLAADIAHIEEDILTTLAQIAVGVDFPDDQDAPDNSAIIARVKATIADIDRLLLHADEGRLYREGLRVALCGAVNAGKSSLLNALLGAERAIVTDEAGTTRDTIEEMIDLDGMPLLLIDTAGFRDTDGKAERLGIDRSRRAAAEAQLLLIVIDAAEDIPEETQRLMDNTTGRPRIIVLNKADLVSEMDILWMRQRFDNTCGTTGDAVVAISAKQGEGIRQLLNCMRATLIESGVAAGRQARISNIRHQQALLRARESLAEALAALNSGMLPDVAGIDIENAYTAVGEVSGKTASAEVLTAIFSRFCVGK
ncbi:MAG: tRNA uridine-5-carboxymethylaminomethyl(34) synthesis GTPase MnmE [Firmicutes bacterium]|nr:tRNA uridine-5-carboxymethylaminomethyl(34) synthesis GTPase MnmE [Bacillota bacterium]